MSFGIETCCRKVAFVCFDDFLFPADHYGVPPDGAFFQSLSDVILRGEVQPEACPFRGSIHGDMAACHMGFYPHHVEADAGPFFLCGE